MSVLELDCPTPFVYVDEGRLEANIARTADRCASAGVALRPHVKTHKTVAIARLQLEAGAIGLTVAKLDEAAAFVRAGLRTSYLVAQPWWGRERAATLFELVDEGVEVLPCVDDPATAESLSAFARGSDRTVEVVLILDTGYGRLGVDPGFAVELAQQVERLPGVRVAGIRSYAGTLYQPAPQAARLEAARRDAETLAAAADRLADAGIPCRIVSLGNSPHSRLVEETGLPGQITELRAGNYVFGDRMQVDLGADPDDWALTVVTSVVSAPDGRRAIVDAGLKSLSATRADVSPGIAAVLDRPDLVVDAAWEECARVVPADGGRLDLRPGDRLRLVPNHACEVPNLAERIVHGRDGAAAGFWTPEARGKVH